jgi:GT2 family glycosyltransferase
MSKTARNGNPKSEKQTVLPSPTQTQPPEGGLDRREMYINEIIEENTDQSISPQPGNGLIASRINRVKATLGENAELVSIVVQAYNRLEKTKICVECILKYTRGIEYELILIDNGSTDGTLDYFKSVDVPRRKIIHVTKNVGSYVPGVLDHLSGRYYAFVCNDTYVTKNWLSNLLKCLKSDPAIGMVVPAITNGTNYQGADVTITSLDDLWGKAAAYNVSDPRLWHERLRLAIQLGVYKREAFDVTGVSDYGFFHDFADDDLVFRMRRAGFKTIFCKDTIVHHDHILSNAGEKDPVEFKRSIEAGKKDFQNKFYGLDAWQDVNNYEWGMISLVEPMEFAKRKTMDILGIDVSCGAPILEVKNKLREAELYNTRLSVFTTDPKYWLDLKTICAGEVVVDRIESFREYFQEIQFDYVVLGKPINFYSNPFELLQNLIKRVKSDGHILLKLRNTFDAITAFKVLGVSIQVDNRADQIDHVYQLNVTELIGAIKSQGYVNNKIAAENWPLDEQVQNKFRSLILATGIVKNPDEVCSRAMIRDYIIDIVKA